MKLNEQRSANELERGHNDRCLLMRDRCRESFESNRSHLLITMLIIAVGTWISPLLPLAMCSLGGANPPRAAHPRLVLPEPVLAPNLSSGHRLLLCGWEKPRSSRRKALSKPERNFGGVGGKENAFKPGSVHMRVHEKPSGKP